MRNKLVYNVWKLNYLTSRDIAPLYGMTFFGTMPCDAMDYGAYPRYADETDNTTSFRLVI